MVIKGKEGVELVLNWVGGRLPGNGKGERMTITGRSRDDVRGEIGHWEGNRRVYQGHL